MGKMSVEEKYAAPPSYDNATGNVSALPGAGVSSQATPQAQPQVQTQIVYVQQRPQDPNSQIVHCDRCCTNVPTYTRTYYGDCVSNLSRKFKLSSFYSDKIFTVVKMSTS